MAHFVRCNKNRKNVYAFPSRPVIHWAARKDNCVDMTERTLKIL
jgi:hypothetical protein